MGTLISLLATSGAPLLLAGIAGPFAPVIAALFTKNRITIYLCIACVIAGAAGGWYVTHKFWEADKLAAVNAAMAFKDVKFHTVTKIETVVQEHIQVIHDKGKEIVRYVYRDVTPAVERACPSGLPRAFVRLHDAAASNSSDVLSGGAPSTDADPSGVGIARALQVIGDNYTEYYACREQVIYWNRFYSCLRTAKDAKEVDKCVQRK